MNNTTREDVLRHVQEIVANHLVMDRVSLVEEDKTLGDLGADSLDVVDMVIEMEVAFDVDIPDNQYEVTVSKLVDYIVQCMLEEETGAAENSQSN